MECKKLFETIDELYEHYVEVWDDVCTIESPTDYKEGVDAVGTYFAHMAKEKGWKVETFKQEVSGDVVCITLNPYADKAPISFSAHLDTVHPVGLFGSPTVRRDDKNIYGPGVMDCKGGAVASFLAMDALDRVGFRERPVQLLLQSDEEKGSMPSNLATINYICDKAANSVAFLNCEGHVKDTAVLKRKGILRYEITVHGKALHSSRCPDAANAICEAAYKIIELEKMKSPDGLTCNCGVINGGTTANTVAEECTVIADIRFADEEQEKLAREIVEKVTDTVYVEGCISKVKQISHRPAMMASDANYKLLDTMNEIYEKNGLPKLTARFCYSGSDTAYTTIRGIPCVDSIGTEGGNIHSIDEYCVLESLASSAKRLASVAYCI
ncbi:MAG: M20/M25/M40 family metallo-hydrolase [Clostridia bacterium]|nr:M20/M25/M40 family metallo-hydrolase [Clostridia bacterium]